MYNAALSAKKYRKKELQPIDYLHLFDIAFSLIK
jgi:hypothetical protein